MKSIHTYITEKLNIKDINVNKDNIVGLGLPSGTLWCKYNVGATNGSTAESWYGNYFTWGDTKPVDVKKYDWDNYKYDNGNNKLTKYCPIDQTDYWCGSGKPDNALELDIQDDMANANMTGTYKLPTKEQLEELIKNTTNEWITNYQGISGLNGRLFTSKTNNNTLFIPAAGYCSGDMIDVGYNIRIWSSLLYENIPVGAYALNADKHYIYLDKYNRRNGFSVRPVLYI